MTAEQRREIIGRDPHVVHYALEDGTFKLAAGWLIDACGWKGSRSAALGCTSAEALGAGEPGRCQWGRGGDTGTRDSGKRVWGRFGIRLEPEPSGSVISAEVADVVVRLAFDLDLEGRVAGNTLKLSPAP